VTEADSWEKAEVLDAQKLLFDFAVSKEAAFKKYGNKKLESKPRSSTKSSRTAS
jgi:hypothetical protein